jgi:hypothetical protein
MLSQRIKSFYSYINNDTFITNDENYPLLNLLGIDEPQSMKGLSVNTMKIMEIALAFSARVRNLLILFFLMNYHS